MAGGGDPKLTFVAVIMVCGPVQSEVAHKNVKPSIRVLSGMNCTAFTTNDDIMWMDNNSVQGGGNQNMGAGNDILGIISGWQLNPNTTLNVNGDSGDDLVFINKNRGNYSLNNFVVNGTNISAQITVASSNKGNIVVNNIEALCFLDGCFGSVPVMPSPVPLPAAAWLFISAIAGLAGAKRMSRSKRTA